MASTMILTIIILVVVLIAITIFMNVGFHTQNGHVEHSEWAIKSFLTLGEEDEPIYNVTYINDSTGDQQHWMVLQRNVNVGEGGEYKYRRKWVAINRSRNIEYIFTQARDLQQALLRLKEKL